MRYSTACASFHVFLDGVQDWVAQTSIKLKSQLNLNVILSVNCSLRRVWRHQRGNQIPYIEEEQTTQWPKEKVQKDKQRSTKYTHKTKDRETRTP